MEVGFEIQPDSSRLPPTGLNSWFIVKKNLEHVSHGLGSAVVTASRIMFTESLLPLVLIVLTRIAGTLATHVMTRVRPDLFPPNHRTKANSHICAS